jgi:hypothetical protein
VITPEEIVEKARRRYPAFLSACLRGESFVPIEFPAGKPPTDLAALRKAGTTLKENAKEVRGSGYVVLWVTRQTRSIGTQDLPERVVIPTQPDFLKLLGKEREVERFLSDVALIRSTIPSLEAWMQANPLLIVEYHQVWAGLLAVCQYFLEHPRPMLYIRELPINVHTKFIEQHKPILRSLLDALLAPEHLNESNIFEERFGLRVVEPRVWLRLLDRQWEQRYNLTVDDLSLPLSQFARLNLSARHCIITENKMNFLTIPMLPDTIALWGGGFNIANLSGVEWLRGCRLLYWGDLDIQGFQILALLRRDFPTAQSLMMDWETFDKFKEFAVSGTPTTTSTPPYLNAHEAGMAEYLATHNLRLEQERIPQHYALINILQSVHRTET